MSRISSFIHFDAGENFEREYFIAHTSMKRFNARVLAATILGMCIFVVPGLLLLLYFSLRKLKISYGYATITGQRLLYYEYSDHEAEKYHFVKSLYLSDITAMQFRLERTLLRKSFHMAAFTEFKALDVGGASWLGLLNFFGKSGHLEPGPDALEFIQQISGLLAARKYLPESVSKVGSV